MQINFRLYSHFGELDSLGLGCTAKGQPTRHLKFNMNAKFRRSQYPQARTSACRAIA